MSGSDLTVQACGLREPCQPQMDCCLDVVSLPRVYVMDDGSPMRQC